MAHDYIQEFYRWRLDEDDINSESSGWLAAENTDIIHGTGIHVRLRIKVRETGAGGDSIAHKLQVQRNAGSWVDVLQDGTAVGGTPPVLVVASPNFSDAAAITTEYLTSTVGNVNGEGIAPVQGPTNSVTGAYTPNTQEIEFEWNLKIMSFFDNFEQNVLNDILRFRMVELDGTIYGEYAAIPQITVTETDYYIGGTPAETPNKLIATDSNGTVYYFLEPAESTQDIMCIRSLDAGRTWREVDGANRPLNDDFESGDIQVVDDTIHLAIQHSNDVYYHRFHMSDHPATPDTWAITDEPVQTGITRDDQVSAIVVRSDGTIVLFWQEVVSGDIRIRYKIRSVGGTWGSAVDVDSTSSTNFEGVVAVLGASDKTHIFYSDITNSNLLHKALTSGDVLNASPDITYSDFGNSNNERRSMTPPVYWDDDGDEKIMIAVMDFSDDKLYSVLYTNDGAPDTADVLSDHTVENDQGGSHMVNAHIGVYNDIVYCVYGRKSSPFGIWLDQNNNDGGWGTDIEQVPDVLVDWILCHPFIHADVFGGDLVFGYIYDDGSNGGCGNQWYNEFVILAGFTTGRAELNGVGSIVASGTNTVVGVTDLIGEGVLFINSSVTHQATGSLSGEGLATFHADVIHQAVSNLPGSATLAGIAEIEIAGAGVQFDGIGTIFPTAEVIHTAAANLAGIGLIDGLGFATNFRYSGAVLTGIGGIDPTAISFKDELAQAVLAGVGGFVPGADIAEVLNSGAILLGIGSLAGIIEVAKFADISLDGVATLVFTPIADWVTGAALVGDSGIRPIGRVSPPGKILLAGVATLTAAYSTLLPARLSLLGEGSWSPKPIAIHRASATLSGAGSIIPLGIKSEESGAILAGSSTLSSIGVSGLHARATLSGAGTVTGTIVVLIGGIAYLEGIAAVLGDSSVIYISGSQLNGIGAISATAEGLRYGSAALNGTGSFALQAEVIHQAISELAGFADLLSFARVTFISASLFAGSSTFTAASLISRAATVALPGAGTFAASGRVEHGGFISLSGIASLVAAGNRLRSVTSSLDGIANIFVDGAISYGGVLSFTGSATFAGAGTYQPRSAAQFDGVGLLVSDGLVSRGGAALLSGESSTIGAVTMTWGGSVLLAGITDIDPTARVIDALPVAFSDTTRFGDDTALIKIGSADALTKVK